MAEEKGDFEIYQSGRYLTVTGSISNGTPKDIMDRPDVIKAVFNDIFGTANDKGGRRENTTKANMSVKNILEKAFDSKNGTAIRSLYEW